MCPVILGCQHINIQDPTMHGSKEVGCIGGIKCVTDRLKNRWSCVAAVERLPTRHYSVEFISLSFRIMGFIVEL